MKVAYIAGKYRDKDEWNVEKNIRKAEAVALKYWRKGYAVICPHKNSAHMGGAVDDEVWLKGDFELIRRSDTIVMLPGWQNSPGARREYELARREGLDIIFEEGE